VIVIVVVLIGIPVLLIGVFSWIILWIIYYQKRRRTERLPQINLNDLDPAMPVAALSVEDIRYEMIEEDLPQNPHVRAMLTKMMLIKYEPNIDKFDTRMWTIWLDKFEEGEMVRIVKGCKHIFHSGCIREMLLAVFSRWLERQRLPRENMYKCPLCQSVI
jgi:hypothetical protein